MKLRPVSRKVCDDYSVIGFTLIPARITQITYGLGKESALEINVQATMWGILKACILYIRQCPQKPRLPSRENISKRSGNGSYFY